jgi:hypothetical protein
VCRSERDGRFQVLAHAGGNTCGAGCSATSSSEIPASFSNAASGSGPPAAPLPSPLPAPGRPRLRSVPQGQHFFGDGAAAVGSGVVVQADLDEAVQRRPPVLSSLARPWPARPRAGAGQRSARRRRTGPRTWPSCSAAGPRSARSGHSPPARVRPLLRPPGRGSRRHR